MIGQALEKGKLNPNSGHSSEAVVDYPLDGLRRFGLSNWLVGPLARPWQFTGAAFGVQQTAELVKGNIPTHGGLLRVVDKVSQINIYAIPTVLVTYQLPLNTKSAQNARLPLNFVSPSLAWSPS